MASPPKVTVDSCLGAAGCYKEVLHYIESLLTRTVPNDTRSCFFLDERFAVQLPLDHVFALQKWDTCLTVKNHLLPLEREVGH